MNINNPFTNGQIKNYLLFYTSIVVIMILFFIATTLFNEIKPQEKRVFTTEVKHNYTTKKTIQKEKPTNFKLLDKAY